jgi:hypothetical protein
MDIKNFLFYPNVSVKKYVRWYVAVSSAVWAMDGSARFTGPKGTIFSDVPELNDAPFISDTPEILEGPATKPSANKGKLISSFSALVRDVLALLNSSIVKAVLAFGNVKTVQSVVMNGIDISVKAIAGWAATASANKAIATATCTLTL